MDKNNLNSAYLVHFRSIFYLKEIKEIMHLLFSNSKWVTSVERTVFKVLSILKYLILIMFLKDVSKCKNIRFKDIIVPIK